MRIKKIDISGFKSFVNPTPLSFSEGVTCIVGPNGCGKSNIVDALRWCLGEQSAKTLRGRSMEDVIFNGSETIGPSDMAEVVLTFDNTDGLSHPDYVDYSEVAVSRRIFRDGTSEYLINNVPRRLKEVKDVFLGTGAGAKAYSIIEQGRIGMIVSARPEDRRFIIEEAAGITRYRERKRIAERKMEHTRQHLERVSDLIDEIGRNLSSLKRQAQKAERYKRYRAELETIELHIASCRYLELNSMLAVTDRDMDRAVKDLEEIGIEVTAAETRVEQARTNQATLQDTVSGIQEEIYNLDNRIRLAESRIEQASSAFSEARNSERNIEKELAQISSRRESLQQERISIKEQEDEIGRESGRIQDELKTADEDLESRNQKLLSCEEEFAGIQSQSAELQVSVAALQADIENMNERIQETGQNIEKLLEEAEETEKRSTELARERQNVSKLSARMEEDLKRIENEKTTRQQEFERLRGEIEKTEGALTEVSLETERRRSRLDSMKELKEYLECNENFPSILRGEEAGKRGVLGILGDFLDCPSNLVPALAAALGDTLGSVVVDSTDRIFEILNELRGSEHGRASLVPMRPRHVGNARGPVPVGPGVLGELSGMINVEGPVQSVLEEILAGVVVVEDLETARRLQQSNAGGWRYVTLAGESLQPSGAAVGGSGVPAQAVPLLQREEIKNLEVKFEESEFERSHTSTVFDSLRKEIAEERMTLEGLTGEAGKYAVELAGLKSEHKNRLEALEQHQARIAEINQKIEINEEIKRKIDSDRQDALRRVAEMNSEIERLVDFASRGADGITQAKQAVQIQAETVTRLKVELGQLEEKKQRVAQNMMHNDESLSELDEWEARLGSQMLEAARRQGESAGQMIWLKEERDVTAEKASLMQIELTRARDEFEASKRDLDDAELKVRETGARQQKAASDISELKVVLRERQMELEHLVSDVWKNYRKEITQILTDYHMKPMPGDEDIAQRNELDRLIQRMGAINLMAIEEYEEKKERHDKLTSQKEDIEKTLRDLEQAITKMNRESRRRFRETFDAVNENFERIFPQMFRGGRGRLELSDPADLLTTGVDIIAQPPGKKLTSIELMSGGEKALTAVSLLFAIFELKPSPFCILDEVDAPFDENNISRFIDKVREMVDRTQFILISHNTFTMEHSDVLSGITMDEPGISKLVSVRIRENAVQQEEEGLKAAAS